MIASTVDPGTASSTPSPTTSASVRSTSTIVRPTSPSVARRVSSTSSASGIGASVPGAVDAAHSYAVMWPVLLTVLAVAVCIGMLVVAHRIEPHWVSKDHRRFLTTSEQVDPLGTVIGRRKEVKGLIADDGRVVLRHRAVMRSTQRRLRHPGQVAAAAGGQGALRAPADPAPPRTARWWCCGSRPPASSSACSTPSAPTTAPPPTTSALPHLIHELGDRRSELVEVDQERVVPVR